MAEDPESLVLIILRRIDGKVDEIALDIRDLKHRVSTLEIGVANLAATEASHYANLALRVDRIDDRIGRIERRLDLVEPA